MYKDNGHCIHGPLTSADLKELVKATGLTQRGFYYRFVKGPKPSEISFRRWLSIITPPATLLAHLTAVNRSLYEIALEVIPTFKERL